MLPNRTRKKAWRRRYVTQHEPIVAAILRSGGPASAERLAGEHVLFEGLTLFDHLSRLLDKYVVDLIREDDAIVPVAEPS